MTKNPYAFPSISLVSGRGISTPRRPATRQVSHSKKSAREIPVLVQGRHGTIPAQPIYEDAVVNDEKKLRKPIRKDIKAD